MKNFLINLFKSNIPDRNIDKIYALQRSEILDECTCNFCLSIDGLVFSPNDEFTKIDTFCKDCRGIWVEIMNDEVDPPHITGAPHEIRKCYDIKSKTLKQQPLTPIVEPNSLAIEEILRREKQYTRHTNS